MDATKTVKLFLLPEELKNDLLAFLMQQPYANVANGVQRLQALAEFIPEPPGPLSKTEPAANEKKK